HALRMAACRGGRSRHAGERGLPQRAGAHRAAGRERRREPLRRHGRGQRLPGAQRGLPHRERQPDRARARAGREPAGDGRARGCRGTRRGLHRVPALRFLSAKSGSRNVMTRRKSMSKIAGIVWLSATLAFTAAPSFGAASDPPAVKAAPPASQDALRKTIAAAVKEGEISYWDAVIQPSTNNALAEAFRKHYGLSSDFKVSYSLSSTGALVTRVDQ